MTRQEVLDAVNAWRARRDATAKPLRSNQFGQAVAIARQNKLISPEHLEWAQRGYFPTPAERQRKRVAS